MMATQEELDQAVTDVELAKEALARAQKRLRDLAIDAELAQQAATEAFRSVAGAPEPPPS